MTHKSLGNSLTEPPLILLDDKYSSNDYIALTPCKELEFKLFGDRYMTTLKIKNLLNQDVAFKVII